MLQALSSRRLPLGLAALAGSAVVALAGCSATGEGAQARSAVEADSAPAAAVEDAVQDPTATQFGVTFINDSSSTVWVSVEDGPQNVELPVGGEMTRVADSYRITRDGGNIMMEMTWKYVDDWQTYQVLTAKDNSGNQCIDETWQYEGANSGPSRTDAVRELNCQGRELTAKRISLFDEVPLTLTLRGDNWN